MGAPAVGETVAVARARVAWEVAAWEVVAWAAEVWEEVVRVMVEKAEVAAEAVARVEVVWAAGFRCSTRHSPHYPYTYQGTQSWSGCM